MPQVMRARTRQIPIEEVCARGAMTENGISVAYALQFVLSAIACLAAVGLSRDGHQTDAYVLFLASIVLFTIASILGPHSAIARELTRKLALSVARAIPIVVAVLLASPSSADVVKGYTALRNGDYTTAISEYKSSALKGDDTALGSLGYAYEEFARATYKNRGDGRSIVEAGIRDLRPFAEEGKADAQYALGNLYEMQSKDLEAAKWFRQAAERDHAMAQWQLGSMYLIGRIGNEGLDKDFYQARVWFEKAANNGESLGMESLGRIYANGKGVAKNYSTAIKWFERAIEKGNRGALVALGSMHETGKVAPKDKERAMEFYRKAASLGDYSAGSILKDVPLAEQGDAEAQYRMGDLWLSGRGVVEDIDEGLRFLEKAANQGYVRAIHLFGYMYQKGWRLPQDFVLAHKWYNIAASLGDEKSGLEREAVARVMTPGQVAEAQKLAREWTASQRKSSAPK